jgi:hypothetical protein
MSLTTIERIQRRVNRIANGKDLKVKPGQIERFSEAATEGDFIRQGDLYLIVAQSPGDKSKFAWDDYLKSSGYSTPKKPSPQLVPGNTQGAKHCLDSLDGVELLLPANWNEESLQGPFLRITKQRTVQHPTHGAVVIPAGFAILCSYQREYDKEQAKERRARD